MDFELEGTAVQTSFSELEYATKKKLTRRDRFLAELDAITPWTALEHAVAPFYPSSGRPGRPPIGLTRMLRIYVALDWLRTRHSCSRCLAWRI